MNEELTRRVVDEIADAHDRNDIIQMVCEQAGVQWPEAEAFVRKVEAEQAHAITARQSPIMLALSAAIMLAGLGLVYYCLHTVLAALHGDLLMQILNLADSLYPVSMGFVGLCMIAGGAIGLYRHWLRYFET